MNGYKNYETYNIALWISNDGTLYELALCSLSYPDFVVKAITEGISETEDGVSFLHPDVDTSELSELIDDFR